MDTEHTRSRLMEASSSCEFPSAGASPRFKGKRVAMVTFSPFPGDPRPRRAVDALLDEGMRVDLICLSEGSAPPREVLSSLNVRRLPITHRRGGPLSYAYNYSAFIFMSAFILGLRSLRRRYHLVYVHNMPDILVLSALIPKALGAKVLLDLHDPMPELMTTIFNLDQHSLAVRMIQWLEKWSIARADGVVTVNTACKRIFAARSCAPQKIGVVMNSPDDRIFPFQTPRSSQPPDRIFNKRFVIMYHGSLVERNGLDLAVDALAQVHESVPTAELNIYGRKTPFLERVLDDARKKGLEDKVHYLGPRGLEVLVREIENCDVGIVPNQRNAFTEINTPTRIFEYLALGKPVIAPRTPGIQDYFSRESLVFFESGNAGDLAQKIEDVALHYDIALASAAKGQLVYGAHTWNQEKRTLVNLTSRLVDGTD
jgi:glycosyltransferase involved in cell wall biosynthesis